MKNILFLYFILMLFGCATDIDLQPKKESSFNLSMSDSPLRLFISKGTQYQDMPKEVQSEYIRNIANVKKLELLLKNKVSENTILQYLRYPEKANNIISEAPSVTISAKAELIDKLVKYDQFYADYLVIPDAVNRIWVILQNHGELVDGSSQFIDITDKSSFTAKLDSYIEKAKKSNKRLIITASNTDNTEWYQTKIKFKGDLLKETLYRSPDQNKNFIGAEIPLISP